jgi:hypothetical protein
MQILRSAVLLALLLTACTTTEPKPAPAPDKFVNLVPAYAAFWDETRTLDPVARVAAFRARFEPLFPGFYSPERLKAPQTVAMQDQRIAKSFEDFPAIRTKFETTGKDFAAMLDSAETSFVATFPDFRPTTPIYLTHSLGEMDGGTRTINGHTALVFGADVMARVHGGFTSERPFFHHELFHVYHVPKYESCDAVWCSVWTEGLAVLVAKRLNPDASDDELLLTFPRSLRDAVEANRKEAVCAIRARFDSEKAEDYRPLFNNPKETISPRLPGRFAYYVGYLVAQQAETTRSLQQLAALTPAEARPVVSQALDRLARCDPPHRRYAGNRPKRLLTADPVR